MNRHTKIAAATLLLALCSRVYAYETQEVWAIEAYGFIEKHTLTASFKRIDGKLYIDEHTLNELGIPSEKLQNEALYLLETLGVVELDEIANVIKLKLYPQYLPETTFNLGRQTTTVRVPDSALPDLVVNYELSTTAGAGNNTSLLLDGSYHLLGKYRLNTVASVIKLPKNSAIKWNRLGSSLSFADSVTAISWTLGDTVSSSGTGVNPVNFTGFQYKKDYSLQPGFVTQPVGELRGAAAMPSTLEVYMDNRRVLSNRIPAGPFSIANIIPQVGASNALVIIRDELGQERIIEGSILGAQGLLKPGFTNYSVQFGRLRSSDKDADNLFISGYYNRGISDTFTVEFNAERSDSSSTQAAVSHIGLGMLKTTPLGAFALRARTGTGRTTMISYSNGWRSGELSATINASGTYNTDDYRILGARMKPAKRSTSLQGALQWSAGRSASFYRYADTSGASSGVTMSFSAARAYAPSFSISLGKNKSTYGGNWNAAFGMTIPFDMMSKGRTQTVNATTRYQSEQGRTDNLNFANSTLSQTGYNYGFASERSSWGSRFDANVTRLSYSGEGSLSTSSVAGSTAVRGRLRGAAIFAGDDLHFTPWLTGGYARVEADIPDIKVLVNGVAMNITDRNGLAYVPVMSAYTPYLIQLDSDSNLDVGIDVAPIDVMVKQQSGAVVRLKRISGTMLPIASLSSGTLTIGEITYPITDRGAYVELEPGDYQGHLSDGNDVKIKIIKVGKGAQGHVYLK